MAQPRFTNRLAQQSSPYLRQHAHNPVDWFPWGEEAIARARQLDRPIFLSIGYSACHWCHVMEHESFEDEGIAAILNEHFVCVKVDREERPDLDQVYMAAVQMISGHGGWPMSVFLTPGLRPFTGGTYFPPRRPLGQARLPPHPAFARRRLAQQARRHRRRRCRHHPAPAIAGRGPRRGRRPDARPGAAGRRPPAAQLRSGPRRLRTRAKFLHTMDLRLLLRAWNRSGDAPALHAVRHTLDCMSRGGIYDHLGGGFARYSTDERWLAPHFEKMLYDNALMAVALLEAYQATGDAAYRETAEETLGWVLAEMASPEGPFYSTLDADSEGEEGRFYVWKAEEIDALLGPEAAFFKEWYNVSPRGNWEDPHAPGEPKNILHRTRPLPAGAERERLARCRAVLLAARAKRVRPGLDDKCLTAWNGLMITALATASAVLDRDEYARAAGRAASFLLARMRRPDGRMLRTWSPGHEPKLDGYLEDHAFLLEGLVVLYEATFEPRWIDEASALAQAMLDGFADTEEGGFYFTGRGHEQLIARSKDPHDNATPSAGAVAVTALFRLARLTGRSQLVGHAERTMRMQGELMRTHPSAAAQMLIAADFWLGPVRELALIGDPASEATRRAVRAVHRRFDPLKVAALGRPGQDAPASLPLLSGKPAVQGVALYVCQDMACGEPVIGADAIEAMLG